MRSKKIFEDKGLKPLPAKGELTADNLSLPPVYQTSKEFVHAMTYFNNGGFIRFSEKTPRGHNGARSPSVPRFDAERKPLPKVRSENTLKDVPRKEILEYAKTLKQHLKIAEKQVSAFMKQFEKSENQAAKRDLAKAKRQDLEREMFAELAKANSYRGPYSLLAPRYMEKSKLGLKAPSENVLILCESSDKMAEWLEEAKEEVKKFLETVIGNDDVTKAVESFNVVVFTKDGATNPWKPTYSSTEKDEKGKGGLPDAIKWFMKTYNPKTALTQAYPPNWIAALDKMTENAPLPNHIYVVCSRPPDNDVAVLKWFETFRTTKKDVPVSVVAFDPEVADNGVLKSFFKQVVGPDGHFLVDKTKSESEELVALLKSAASKKKQIDKIDKQLVKLETTRSPTTTLDEQLNNDRQLLHKQVAIRNCIENDLILCDLCAKGQQVEIEPPGFLPPAKGSGAPAATPD